MKTLSRSDVALLLRASNDQRVCSMADDAAVLQACANVLNEAMVVACQAGTQRLAPKTGSSTATPPAPVPKRSADAWVIGSQATKSFNATFKMAADPPRTRAQLAGALVEKALPISGIAEEVTDSMAFRATNFIGGQMMSSIGLAKVATMTPTRAGITITLTLAEKVTSAAGFAEFDKCKVAIASLATTAGLTAVAAPTGIGAVVGAVAIAAEAFNVVGQCRAR